MRVKILHQPIDNILFDNFSAQHSKANAFHLSGWMNIISKTYKYKTYYIVAKKKDKITGILPIVHFNNFLFSSSLISIPFFDYCGILAEDAETEKQLLIKAVKLAERLNIKTIELRHLSPLSWADDIESISCETKSGKVRMLLELPDSSKKLMKSFKSKLRSQIKRPIKAGLYAKIGKLDLLEDFYNVFAINMRDLGSPVHSKRLIENVIRQFPGKAKIVTIYERNEPIACSLMVGFKDTIINPWASALRKYSRLSPNMLLYWTMLKYACDNGYSYFDFGRSTPNEGTYRFKKQWGAKEMPLYWHYLHIGGWQESTDISTDKSKFDAAIQYWKKLPVSMTKIIGPPIRKRIGL